MRHFKIILNLFLLGFILVVASCSSNKINSMQKTLHYAELKDYQGIWYEIARLPIPAEAKCTGDISFDYKITNNRVDLTKVCTQSSGGYTLAKASGFIKHYKVIHINNDNPQFYSKVYEVIFSPSSGKVGKFGKFGEHYRVVSIEIKTFPYTYKLLAIISKDRKYLWILSRSKRVNRLTYTNTIRGLEKAWGFDSSQLIIAPCQLFDVTELSK